MAAGCAHIERVPAPYARRRFTHASVARPLAGIVGREAIESRQRTGATPGAHSAHPASASLIEQSLAVTTWRRAPHHRQRDASTGLGRKAADIFLAYLGHRWGCRQSTFPSR